MKFLCGGPVHGKNTIHWSGISEDSTSLNHSKRCKKVDASSRVGYQTRYAIVKPVSSLLVDKEVWAIFETDIRIIFLGMPLYLDDRVRVPRVMWTSVAHSIPKVTRQIQSYFYFILLSTRPTSFSIQQKNIGRRPLLSKGEDATIHTNRRPSPPCMSFHSQRLSYIFKELSRPKRKLANERNTHGKSYTRRFALLDFLGEPVGHESRSSLLAPDGYMWIFGFG